MEQTAMHMERWETGHDLAGQNLAGQNLAANAILADGAMKRFVERGQSGNVDLDLADLDLEEDSLPSPAMSGVLVAIALSLPFWMAIIGLCRRLWR